MSKRESILQRFARYIRESRGLAPTAAVVCADRSRFDLYYETTKIGELSFENGLWTFKYSDDFRKSQLRTITEFPDRDREYQSHELWPFFLMRIPSLRREAIRDIVKKEAIDIRDEVKLLDRFGRRTVANPFELVKVQADDSHCALAR